MKIIFLIIISILLYGCSQPITSVLIVDNSTCKNSIVKGATSIAWEDLDIDESYKNVFFNSYKQYRVAFNKKELNHFFLTFETPKNVKEKKKRTYFYYIQKVNGECWAKLYKKEYKFSKYSTISIATGAILTFSEYKLDLCNCSDNSASIDLIP